MDRTADTRPDWVQANPAKIAANLARALAKPSGGWFVLGASRLFRGAGPFRAQVNDAEVVLWRSTSGGLHAAPGACPHMGAHLGDGKIVRGQIVCPWHGLALGGADGTRRHGDWSPFPVHDDGVLVWVQPNPTADDVLALPVVSRRPTMFLEGVIRRDVVCEPEDIIANRLDPWHGAHFHPYAFSRLRVIDETDDAIDLVVAYKVVGKIEVEVTARFATPEPRTIVMSIIKGEGTGSVVETHATPITTASSGRAPLTAVIEATLATSDRPGFVNALKGAVVARPVIRFLANRLWVDDAAYAERRYALRKHSGTN